MCCVATTMSAPADPAFVLINVYVGILIWLRALTISVAASRRPPYVFISKTTAEASLLSAVFTARRKNASSDGATSPCNGTTTTSPFWMALWAGAGAATANIKARQMLTMNIFIFQVDQAWISLPVSLWQFHQKQSNKSPLGTTSSTLSVRIFH